MPSHHRVGGGEFPLSDLWLDLRLLTSLDLLFAGGEDEVGDFSDGAAAAAGFRHVVGGAADLGDGVLDGDGEADHGHGGEVADVVADVDRVARGHGVARQQVAGGGGLGGGGLVHLGEAGAA